MVRKVDPLQLEALLRSGMSQADIAQKLGVHKSNVSRQTAALVSASSQNIMFHAAEKMTSTKINAMGKLEKIMELVEQELDYVQKALKEAKGDERRQWEKSQIEHAAEIRKQLGLLREICETLYNIEQVEHFRNVVLSVIGKVDEKVRDEILRKLGERRHAASAFGPGQLGV